MAQRIVRAKGRIKAETLPYEVPGKAELEDRLEIVLRVIYLVFSEGHASGAAEILLRTDLCEEAIRLARLLREHVAHPDIDGLLALMLLQHSRRAARLGADGKLTPLDEQDRTLWNVAEIEEGGRPVRSALSHPPLASYTLQAAIAAVHAATRDGRDTDWTAIIGWYDLLAIAIGMRDGPARGLAIVDTIQARGELAEYRYADLTRADFLRKLGRIDEARAAYHAALERTPAPSERRFIERRLSELDRG
jgi:RNA polymerase sigma-70 factor (ECF subfamily)